MLDEQVLSVWIGETPAGYTTVQVVGKTGSGERIVTHHRGSEAQMWSLVHGLVDHYDLVPIWDEDEWDDHGEHRPPAPFYTTRELAPPTHLMLAS